MSKFEVKVADPKPKLPRIIVDAPYELCEELKALARKNGCSVAEIVRQALRFALDNMK